jgi:uncharacterized protein YrrD
MMQYVKGATVNDTHKEKIGELERVVIDPKDGSVSHLVVRKGWLFGTDKVVPINQVNWTNEEEIRLSISKEKMDHYPDFTEVNYVPYEDLERGAGNTASNAIPAVYWYPTASAVSAPGLYPSVAMAPYQLEEKENIPEGTVPLKEGARVVGRDGKHVGDIEKVMTDNQKDRITYVLITKGMISKEKKLIPAHWIQNVKEDSIELAVDSKFIDKLHPYQD